MSDLTVSVFRIKIKGEEKILLPYFPGVTLRGAFGMALKRVTCVTRLKDCETCILNQKCVYATSFESIFAGGSPYLRGTQRAPHPVIVYPLQLGKSITRRGGTYTVGLTVFGDARGYLPYYVFALSRLGEIGLGRNRGRFRIASVEEMVKLRGWRKILHEGSDILVNDGVGIAVKDVLKVRTRQKRLVLQTVTPLRMKKMGKLLFKPYLYDLVTGVLVRLRILSSLYSDGAIDLLSGLDIKGLLKGVTVEDSRFSWWDSRRYSRRQGVSMNLGGVVGRMVLSGELNRVYPILKVGELIHLGKNTAFGLGRYTVRGSNYERDLCDKSGQLHI